MLRLGCGGIFAAPPSIDSSMSATQAQVHDAENLPQARGPVGVVFVELECEKWVEMRPWTSALPGINPDLLARGRQFARASSPMAGTRKSLGPRASGELGYRPSRRHGRGAVRSGRENPAARGAGPHERGLVDFPWASSKPCRPKPTGPGQKLHQNEFRRSRPAGYGTEGFGRRDGVEESSLRGRNAV